MHSLFINNVEHRTALINYNLYSFEGLKILRFYWLCEVWPIVCYDPCQPSIICVFVAKGCADTVVICKEKGSSLITRFWGQYLYYICARSIVFTLYSVCLVSLTECK